jgi:hypothetical protein
MTSRSSWVASIRHPRLGRQEGPPVSWAFLYPADDFEELKQRLGFIDYKLPGQALQPEPETD